MVTQAPDSVQRFARSLRAVGGEAHPFRTGNEAAALVERILAGHDAGRTLLWDVDASDEAEPPGLSLALRARGVRVVRPAQAGVRIDRYRAAITSARAGIAESGTLLVGGRPGAWGLSTVLPWVHVALLRQSAIAPDLASAFVRFGELFAAGERDWVWITGPSKTADIGQTLVHGAHGPNAVRVLVYLDEAAP